MPSSTLLALPKTLPINAFLAVAYVKMNALHL